MWPTKNTAFLVIHGIGEHRPFETIDPFVRGLWNVLKVEDPGLKVEWKHRFQRHGDWIENYVSLAPEGRPSLDFYEYYWDCYMVREVTTAEVLKWIDAASLGARTFYSELEGETYKYAGGRAKEYRDANIDLFKDGEFEMYGYRRIIVAAVSQIKLMSALSPLLGMIPKVGIIIKPLAHLVSQRIVGLLGDLVIYTTSDARSANYEVRQKILSGAVEQLKLLLGNDYYQQVIVAGHSLGSVIAYDSLNRVVQDMSAKGGISPGLAPRIAGLVTFGSPLDKIFFFFRERAPQDNFVQRQILSHFHGYKSIALPGDKLPIPIDDPIRHELDKSVWLNFYHRKDPISGHLDAYRLGEQNNIECKEDVGVLGAHGHYWKCEAMYRRIASQFLK